MPATIWKRHPRYSIVLFVILIATSFILILSGSIDNPDSSLYHRPHHNPSATIMSLNDDIEQRLERSEKYYNKALKDRKALLDRFGPRPEDVVTFPDHDKPYTICTFRVAHDISIIIAMPSRLFALSLGTRTHSVTFSRPSFLFGRNFFPAAFNCPYEVRHLGTLADGGKWVCGLSRMEREPDCVVYSFGISGDSTFESELLQNTDHCKIWGYDFSVGGFADDIPKSERWRTNFQPYGLAGKDSAPSADPKMYSLQSLMDMNGHDHIDLLKIDIEGWEFEALEELIKPYLVSGKPLPFAQLQLEMHVLDMRFVKFLGWWQMLETAGLRPFWTEPNLVYIDYTRATPSLTEYSFINIKGDNVLTRPTKPRHAHDAVYV
ncbi:hypothetical protein D9757_011434 [Collybiopsis confluens]|uniref:Methyltransferase domain-containing protein n=1 Tax=Collybiopsis confluens TaxID=2823264 RepID=A0A8H5LPT7_9AGAR|nr:hypothetical protein D9757_011434 [Collybiopsis confluens]